MAAALVNLLGTGEIRRLAEGLGLRPTKTLGQNFVHDANTVRRIVEASEVGPADHVLEVGPGLGSLTLALLQVAGAVTAVEIDSRLAALLPVTARDHLGQAAARLTVIEADALRIGYGDVPGTGAVPADATVTAKPTALVANLPYNVSVPVILHLLATFPSIESMLVMVQAEVADRLAAPPGSRTYGAPSAKLAWFGRARKAGMVSRAIFWPVPGVDSTLVAFRRHHPEESAGRPHVEAADVFAVIDAAFAQRRKTLRSALARWAGSTGQAEAVCRAAGVDPSVRGETLGVDGFIALAAARAELASAGSSPSAEEHDDPVLDGATTESTALTGVAQAADAALQGDVGVPEPLAQEHDGRAAGEGQG